MKYSTGKGARLRHSTAREWDEIKKEKERSGYQEIKHSTGETPAIKHSTGVEFDYKALLKDNEDNEGTAEGIPSKVLSKSPSAGDEYIGLYRISQSDKEK